VSGLSASAVAAVYAAASVEAVTEQTLVDIAALAMAQGLSPADLKPVLALAFLKSGFASRFDVLQPAMFSSLWLIKVRGKQAEERGENTDKLWRAYWRAFEAAARQGVD